MAVVRRVAAPLQRDRAQDLLPRLGPALVRTATWQERASAFDSYVSDPTHAVPYRHRPIEPTYPGPGWLAWLVENQRFVHQRPDTLSRESDALEEDLAIAGDIVAHVFASTMGTDSDWIVKLIDVYPEDYPKDPPSAATS